MSIALYAFAWTLPLSMPVYVSIHRPCMNGVGKAGMNLHMCMFIAMGT